MTPIVWVLGVLAAALIAEEMLGWITPLCRLALRSGASRLPREWRARYAEEWEAELLALAGGPVTKLIWTVRTRVGVRALNAALAHSRPLRVQSAELSGSDGTRLAELVVRAQAGDAGAFGELYDECSLDVYRYIYAHVSSPPLAEDLTAETFLGALKALDTFRFEDQSFGTWLNTIARTHIGDDGEVGPNQ